MPAGTCHDVPTRIVLVGFRASGKSTIGRLVAARLGLPFADADAAVEAELGMTIPACFASRGETAFRDAESVVLTRLLTGPQPLVLATGGGAVLRQGNRDALAAAQAFVAYLHAPAGVLQERLRRSAGGRPSLTGADVADEVPALLAQREPIYRAVATAVVDATRPAPDVADAIWRLTTDR